MKKILSFVLALALMLPAMFAFGDDENLLQEQEVIDLLQSDPPEEENLEADVEIPLEEIIDSEPEPELELEPEDPLESEQVSEDDDLEPVLEDEPEIIEEEVPEPEIPKILINEILPDPSSNEAENEFIELFNAGDSLVDLSGWVLDDSNLEDDAFYAFDDPEGDYMLAPGAYMVLFRPETGITLNNTEDVVYLFDGLMDEIDSFSFTESISGASWGRFSENLEMWQLFPSPSPGELNVFSNQIPVAQIEIQGGTKDMVVNVTGESSVDPDGDALDFTWTFEEGVVISKENPPAYTYSTPGVKNIVLMVSDPFGGEHQVIFEFEAKEKESESAPDLNEASEPSDSGPTTDPVDDASSQEYPLFSLIHEILPDPVGSDVEGEWVELYNDTDESIDLSGWILDDGEGASSPFYIPEGTIFEAGDYLTFQNPELNLSLKNDADVVRLLNPDKIESQVLEYSEAVEGWSFSKSESGEWVWTPELTPNQENAFPPEPMAYLSRDIVFDSALPNPEGADAEKEKIRLKNRTNELIDLSYWTLADLKSEVVLLDLAIEPGEILTLSSDDFSLNLNNTDESLTLIDPTGNVIDEMTWETSSESVWLFNASTFSDGMEVEVLEVVDGDTFKIMWEDREFTVRLLGVDTPETVHPSKSVEYFGEEASTYLKNIIQDKTIRLEFEERKMDAYGRLLAYVFVEGQLVNAEIIREGYGVAYTRFDFNKRSEFERYEAEAREAGRGLWEDDSVVKVLESEQTEGENEALDESTSDPELLKDADETEGESDIDSEVDLKVLPAEVNCDSDFLKLHAIFPSPKKGAEEYIELINQGEVPICLAGWQLDDDVEGGSKPFTFEDGQLAPAEVVRFEKTVTKLSLNNSNDCATLIRPNGEVGDQICYEKTKKNEVFSHEGGNSGSSDSSKSSDAKLDEKASNSTSEDPVKKHSFTRESSEYRTDLINATFSGVIVGVDSDEGVLVVKLQDDSLLLVSYADSLFEVNTVRKLLNLQERVTFDVYKTAEQVHLISMRSPSLQNQGSAGWGWLWLLGVPGVGLGLWVVKNRTLITSLFKQLA